MTPRPIFNRLVLLSILLLVSCEERKQIPEMHASIIELDIKESLKKQESIFFLSEISDKIKYIPLETNDSCLLYGIYRLMLTHDHILASDGMALYQFDLSGRFIRQIGRLGRGPGEHGRRIKVDTQNEDIYIFSSGVMNIYDQESGSFKRSFKVDFDVSDFIVSIDNKILFFTSDLPTGPLLFSVNEVYLTDNNGQIIDSIVNNSRLNNRSQTQGYVHLYRRNGVSKYIYNLRDTLYALTEDFTRRPYLVFNLDNSIDRDKLIFDFSDNDQPDLADFISVLKIVENNSYLFLEIRKGIAAGEVDISNMLYDNTSGSLFRTSGIINDIDGGMTFWPGFSIENTLISSYLPHEIIEYYESTVGITDHSEDFINLVRNLNESDNPVLVLIEAGNN